MKYELWTASLFSGIIVDWSTALCNICCSTRCFCLSLFVVKLSCRCMGGGWGGDRRKSGLMFISGATRGGRNTESWWAGRRVLTTSLRPGERSDQIRPDWLSSHLGVAAHRQNKQGRPGLETTGSALTKDWAGLAVSARSSQGAE